MSTLTAAHGGKLAAMRLVTAVLTLALAPGCAANPATAPESGPIKLTAHIDRGQIARGGTATVTFRLENVSANAVTLDFSSGCQVMPYVVKRPSDAIVYPADGGWVCTMALTQLTLPPKSEKVVDLTVIAGGSSGDRVGLAPGEYAFFARIDSQQHKLESPRVNLTVL